MPCCHVMLCMFERHFAVRFNFSLVIKKSKIACVNGPLGIFERARGSVDVVSSSLECSKECCCRPSI